MNVVNVHKRIINQPKQEVSKLLKTLATQDDKIWPNKKWPAIRFKDGLVVGAKGGHGIIRYNIAKYIIGDSIYFEFTKPSGFIGYHNFKINHLGDSKAEVAHCIDMKTYGMSTFSWGSISRTLHDALTEDALDKIENQFSTEKKVSTYSVWVKILRAYFKVKRKLTV